MNASKLLLRYAAGERDFRAARCREADLSLADLHEANLRDADLRQANLAGSQLCGVDLGCANLSGANLQGANLIQADLRSANLWGVNAIECDFTKADLRDADLRGADLTKATLKGADLRGANLQGADLSEVDLVGADLRGSTLSRAYLYRADLTRANLNNSDLQGADLSGVALTRVRAIAANFESANLTGACIQNWYIDCTTNLKHIICDYIYLQENQQERYPPNPYETFALGQFARLFQKCRETLNLIFPNEIDWSAFLVAFEQLQQECEEKLRIRTMGYTEEGLFSLGIDIPLEANPKAIERSFQDKYEVALKDVEGRDPWDVGVESQSETTRSPQLLEIVKLLAHHRISI